MENIDEFLDGEVPAEEISEKDGGFFQDIRVIENLLDELTERSWGRIDHRYSFHKIISEANIEHMFLSTSFVLVLHYGGEERRLLCGSMIRLSDYADNPNIIMTGISEATKAGTKLLGRRFGKYLNEETPSREERKEKGKRAAVRTKPDAKIMAEYSRAILDGDKEKVEKLLATYDIKIEKDYAT